MEGQVYAVPTTDGDGYVLGVVGRAENRRSLGASVLLYFFAPRLRTVPTALPVSELQAKDAISIVKTGCLRIVEGQWPLVGSILDFNHLDWPIPIYGNVSRADPALAWLTRFDDDWSAGAKRQEWRVAPEEARKYPECSSWGVDIASFDATKKLLEIESRQPEHKKK